LDTAEYEMTLGGHVIHVAECVVDDTDFCGFYDEVLLTLQSPLERGVEDVLEPSSKMVSVLFVLFLEPGLGDSADIDILFREEDHTESTDSSRRSIFHLMSLKNEVNVVTKVDSLTIWKGQKMIIIKYRVKGLHPFRINITIVDDPAIGLQWLLDDKSCTRSQNTILELSRVMVHETKQLMTRHGLWIHHMSDDALIDFLKGHFQNFPNGRLTTTRWTDKNDSHSLLGCLIELKYLLDLFINVLELKVLEGFFDSFL